MSILDDKEKKMTVEKAKLALKKLKEKKAALDKQITAAEKGLVVAEVAAKKAKEKTAALKKVAGVKKAVVAKVKAIKKK